MTKKLLYLIVVLSLWTLERAGAQTVLTLDSCYAIAIRNYPLNKQRPIIAENSNYMQQNASKGNFPQMQVGGQATYQSDVTKVPISFPGINIPSLSKDQYKLFAELNQPLTEMMNVKLQKELIVKNAMVESQKIEVELYKLKEGITQIYFAILLAEAQKEQIALLKKDIQNGIDKVTAAMTGGTALKSSQYTLQAELLKVEQKVLELEASKKAYLDMLALYLGTEIGAGTTLEKPADLVLNAEINRPELRLFELQRASLDVQKRLSVTKSIPRLSFFVQGGFGRPALNMLNNDFDFYYIGGLRLSWNLSSFYTLKNEKLMVGLNERSISVQQDLFLFNIRMAQAQKNGDMQKIEALIRSDEEIIKLREQVRTIAQTQLENGVITANDFLQYINAAEQARQNLTLHQMQLLMSQYMYKVVGGI